MLAHRRDAEHVAHEVEAGRRGQPRRRIARAGPVELLQPVVVGHAPRDHGRMQRRRAARARPTARRSCAARTPTCAGWPRTSRRRARRCRASIAPGAWAPSTSTAHAARAARRRHLGERQHQRGLGGDVVEQRQSRARRDRARRRRERNSAGVARRKRQRHGRDRRAALAGDEGGGAGDAAVGLVVDQDLVARAASANERSTALTPLLALSTNTRSSPSTPRNAATCAAAARRRGASGGGVRPRCHQLADHEARRMALDLVEDRGARAHHRAAA